MAGRAREGLVESQARPSTRAADGGGGPSGSQERLLAYHPIVLGDQVIVCDGSRVLAYNLNDRPPTRTANAPRPVEPGLEVRPPTTALRSRRRAAASTGIPRYTLTAVGHRIYARMGATSAAFFDGGGSAQARIELDRRPRLEHAGKAALGAEIDVARASQSAGRPERQPDGQLRGDAGRRRRNVYVAVTDRREQTATYVACFDAEIGRRPLDPVPGDGLAGGRSTSSASAAMQFGGIRRGDFNHRLLSLDGPTLYYQTNLGRWSALEAETGSTLWVATYPRQDPNQLAATAASAT